MHDPLRLGRYALAENIGQGAMGSVFAATEDGTGRRVAVRIGKAGDLRVHHQARVTGQVAHPNVVSVLDIGEDQGRPFVVMERLDGEPLDRAPSSGARPLDERLDVMLQVCAGLQAAHERGVVHGHLKPRHVVVTTAGVVKLTDFGAGLGRPDAYASPEEIGGMPATERSDIFAAGAVFYFLTTGRAPFPSREAAASDPPPALSYGAPDSLGRVLLKALDKDPTRRHQSVQLLRAEIEQVRAGRRGDLDRILKAAIARYRDIEALVAERRALGRRLGLPRIERECDEQLASLAAAFADFARAGLELDGLAEIDAARASEALAQLQVRHNEVLAEVSVLKSVGGRR